MRVCWYADVQACALYPPAYLLHGACITTPSIRYCADLDRCGCKISSVLSLWGDDIMSNMDANTTTSEIRDRIRDRSAQDGIPVLQGVLGGINGVVSEMGAAPASSAGTRVLESADAIQLTFEIDGTLGLDYSREWQIEFLAKCDEYKVEAISVDIWCGTKDEWVLESDDAISEDTVFMGIAIGLMLIYVALALGRMSWVEGRG